MLIGHIHTNPGLNNNGIAFFSLTSQGLPFIEAMAGFEFTVREMNVMPTVAYLKEIVLGGEGSVLLWAGIAHDFRSFLIVIKGNLNAQRYREIFARHVIPPFQNNANTTLFQHDNATSNTPRDTVNFLRVNNIASINDWPAKSPDLNPVDLWVARCSSMHA